MSNEYRQGVIAMNNQLIWSQNSVDSANGDRLQAIASWWSNLEGKEVMWQQRLIPVSGDFISLDWQPQKFDEKLILHQPQLKGITLFWRNHPQGDERNITASKLQLNLSSQKLYAIPQSQSQVVICISLPEVVYQKLNLINPQVAATSKNGTGIILLRDDTAKLEIKITLDSDKLNLLRDRLQTEES